MHNSFKVLSYIQGNKARRFPFCAPLNGEYSPNPTRGDSPQLRRRAELRAEEAAPLPGAGPDSVWAARKEQLWRNAFLTPCAVRALAAFGNALFPLFMWPRRLVKCCPWSTEPIQKSRALLRWILHTYYFCFSNLHGMHLERWPWVKLLLPQASESAQETAFLSLRRWDSEWLGLWAFSSTAVGGGPPRKNPVPDTLSHTQRCPGTSQASAVRAPGGLCTWKAVKHSKGCWADKLKARCAQCAGVHQEVTSRRRQGLWPDCGFREAHIQTRVSFLDREWSGSACLFPLPPPQPPPPPNPYTGARRLQTSSGLGLREWRM